MIDYANDPPKPVRLPAGEYLVKVKDGRFQFRDAVTGERIDPEKVRPAEQAEGRIATPAVRAAMQAHLDDVTNRTTEWLMHEAPVGNPDFWKSGSATAEPLSAEALQDAADAILAQSPSRPAPSFITSVSNMKAARTRALQACGTALRLDAERGRTKWWQFRRRRWLLKLAGDEAGLALMLWETFGEGEMQA